MKILVADKIAPAGVEYLREQDGFEVVEAYGSSPEELLEKVKDVDAIVVRSASTISADVIKAAPRLKAVGRAGVGVDNIDIDAATAHGVVVMNTPGGNTISTAELTFTHLLCSARPVPQANASMKSGKWDKKAFAGTELYNKTIGVLGLGRIGTEVAKRAVAFGMRVYAYDPYLTEDRARSLDVEKVELEDVFRNADFITVHMPKTEETTHMINKESLSILKDGVRIMNCARGGLIDEEALYEGLKSGKIAAAGFDVFESEPLPEDSKLREFDNLVMTPHLGASTLEAQEGVGIEVAKEITAALTGGMVRNAINMPSVDPATLKVLRPYLDLGYKLGTLVQQITPKQVKKLTITFWGKPAELDTMPVTRAVQRGYLSKIAENVNDVNAPYALKRNGVEVQVVKSNEDRDYNELIRVEAVDANDQTYALEGTLIGTAQHPRLVNVNGRELESGLEGWILLVANQDVRGVVGTIGTTLAGHDVNIANMSLSRNAVGGVAISVCELDSRPSKEALDELRQNKAIEEVYLIEL